ncbi:MAG: hypothetical protein RR620_00085 [Clostridium sp.]
MKSQDYVNQGKATLNTAVNSLQQALISAENMENKAVIQEAMNSLNSATQNLSNYQD